MTLVLSPAEEKAPETDNGSSQPVENQEQSNPEENPVMNFFKTLVSDTIWDIYGGLYAFVISNCFFCKIRLLAKNNRKILCYQK